VKKSDDRKWWPKLRWLVRGMAEAPTHRIVISQACLLARSARGSLTPGALRVLKDFLSGSRRLPVKEVGDCQSPPDSGPAGSGELASNLEGYSVGLCPIDRDNDESTGDVGRRDRSYGRRRPA